MTMIDSISVLSDNYVWIMRNSDHPDALIVDPGSATEILAYLHDHKLELTTLLITHHHWDHTHGITALKARYPNVKIYGPDHPSLKEFAITRVSEGDEIILPELSLKLVVMHIPGHTLTHVAYYGMHTESPCLFSGDTLFSAGCGRLFEGTPAQMHASLLRLKQLPSNTAVYCGHEYTQDNLAFAAKVEPDNPDIQTYLSKVKALRLQHKPSLPSTIEIECQVNPFLRCDQPSIRASVEAHAKKSLTEPVQVFSHLRRWKDNF